MTGVQTNHSVSEPIPTTSTESMAADPVGLSGQTIPFLDRVTDADRQVLISQASHKHYATGSVICREGEHGDTLYIIQTGRVAVIKDVSIGYPVLLTHRGPGEIIGEMSLVGQQPRSASVIALEETDVLSLQVDNFRALLYAKPSISWAILNVLNERLYEADRARSTMLLEEQQMTERLAHLSGETERLAKVALARKETLELLAHDVRTPLAVIEGCLQMLRLGQSSDDQESTSQILDLAQRSAKRLLALLEELLAEARHDALSALQPQQPVDLVRLLRATVEAVSITAQQTHLRVDLEVPANLPHPCGETVQLERVIANLLDNAMSYTPAGGRIIVAASDRGSEVEVSVTDTGPGIPLELREQVFERFSQVPGMQARRQGFGLGLYFCRRTIQAHGGRIWAEAGPEGRGSRFAFTIPVKKE
jgi:signal transduction histidine kinase